MYKGFVRVRQGWRVRSKGKSLNHQPPPAFDTLEGRVLLSAAPQLAPPAVSPWSAAGARLHAARSLLAHASAVTVAARAARKPKGTFTPDLLYRNYQAPPFGTYSGQSIYSTTGATESDAQSTSFYPVIYQIAVVNNGTRADSFTISGGAGVTDIWHVTYFDSQVQGGAGGVNISDAVIGGTYTTPLLAVGAMFEFRLEVGPSSFAPGGTSYAVNVKATSVSDPTKVDVVHTSSTYNVVHAFDITRRNFDASGTYLFNVTNRSNVADAFRVTGSAGIRYYDDITGIEITSQVTGAGFVTPSLAYGHTEPLRAVFNSGAVTTSTIIAQSIGDSSKIDFINVTNAAPPGASLKPGFFPIGVFSQPAYLFGRWKSRGVNTLFNYESQGGQITLDDWTTAAAQNQLYMIRQPRPNPADDVAQPFLLAWSHPDEYEVKDLGNNETAAAATANYTSWKQVDPTRPVFGNFDGSDVVQIQTDAGPSDYRDYSASTDWQSSGIYPLTGYVRPEDLDLPARAVDQLQNFSNGQMQFAIIESSPQLAPYTPNGAPGPTPDQFKAEVWEAVVRGAQGIIYFPQSIPPHFNYDNTSASVAAEMTKQDARLTQYGAALESSVDPTSLGISINYPLEATWRSFGGKSYFFVMNTSNKTLNSQAVHLLGVGRAKTAKVTDESRTVALKGGVLADNFAPYSVHVYTVG